MRVPTAEAQSKRKPLGRRDAVDHLAFRTEDVKRISISGRHPNTTRGVDRQTVGVAVIQRREDSPGPGFDLHRVDATANEVGHIESPAIGRERHAVWVLDAFDEQLLIRSVPTRTRPSASVVRSFRPNAPSGAKSSRVCPAPT